MRIASILFILMIPFGLSLDVVLPGNYVSNSGHIRFLIDNHEDKEVKFKYSVLNQNLEVVCPEQYSVIGKNDKMFLGFDTGLAPGNYLLQVDSHKRVLTGFNIDYSNSIIEDSLFDITAEVPDEFKAIRPGHGLLAEINLINFGSKGRSDVFIAYSVEAQDGTVIYNEKELLLVQTELNELKQFNIPSTAKPGTYYVKAGIQYGDGKTAYAEHPFSIVKEAKGAKGYNPLLLLTAITSCLLLGLAVIRYTFEGGRNE